MEFSAEQIAGILEGEIVGNKDEMVSGLSKIEEGKKGTLSFLANQKYEEYIYNTDASIVIVNKTFEPQKSLKNTCTLIKVEDAYASFSQLLELYNQMKFDKVGLSEKADVATNSTIGDDVYIGAFAFIAEGVTLEKHVRIYPNCYIGKNVTIKENTILFSGVRIYHDCVVGTNSIIHSGVIIGSDGFGFAANGNTNYKKINQIGNVVIGNNVEIGANSTIDRATMGSTIIGNGVKLDNLIQVAHNVEIGEHTVIAAQTGIAGSSKIGKNCMIGGQVAISGHLRIADKVKIAGQSGVASSITEVGKIVQGPMAFKIKDFQRSYIIFKKLPEMYETLDKIKKELGS